MSAQLGSGSSSSNVSGQYFATRLGNEIVTLHIGEGDKMATFRIHKKILCDKIPYFDKMFNGQFKEASTQVATFPEGYPSAFQLMISWLYKGTIEDPKPANALTNGGASKTEQLLELYVLAENIGAIQLADETMDLMINFMNIRASLPSLNTMVKYYHKVPENSKLRLFISRAFAHVITTFSSTSFKHRWSNEKVQKAFQESPDLMLDTIALMREISGNLPNPKHSPICDYHEHGKDEPCPDFKWG